MSLGRILLAVAVAACLLGVGVLEVVSERAPRQEVMPTHPRVGELRSQDAEPWWESGETVSGEGLSSNGGAPLMPAGAEPFRGRVVAWHLGNPNEVGLSR